MATILTKWFTEKIHLGEMTIYNELAVVPLFCSRENGTEYITLKTALATGLTVSEVSEGGSVPELKLTNLTGKNVLILDGEELAGAKQNRVLNTSILVVAGDSLVIPVSCTEHGRWAYKSKRFEDSNVCMSPTLRSRKNQSVSSALKSSGRYVSNQGEVWNSISELHASHGTASQTGAMKDVYERKREDINAYQNAFPYQDGQCGIVVLIKGRVAGVEMVSLPEIYHQLHDKLINSYAMDIPLARRGESGPAIVKVHKILNRIKDAAEERFPSVGLGDDCRYKARGLIGTALVVGETVVHLAFFRTSHKNKGITI